MVRNLPAPVDHALEKAKHVLATGSNGTERARETTKHRDHKEDGKLGEQLEERQPAELGAPWQECIRQCGQDGWNLDSLRPKERTNSEEPMLIMTTITKMSDASWTKNLGEITHASQVLEED